jgi:hypothetical protein
LKILSNHCLSAFIELFNLFAKCQNHEKAEYYLDELEADRHGAHFTFYNLCTVPVSLREKSKNCKWNHSDQMLHATTLASVPSPRLPRKMML